MDATDVQHTNRCRRARLSVGLCVYWRRGNRSIHQLSGSVTAANCRTRFWYGTTTTKRQHWMRPRRSVEEPYIIGGRAVISCAYTNTSASRLCSVCGYLMLVCEWPRLRCSPDWDCAKVCSVFEWFACVCVMVVMVFCSLFLASSARINADDSHAHTHGDTAKRTRKKNSDASNTQWPILQYESEILVIIVYWMSLVAWCACVRARACVCLWLSTKLSNQLLLSVYACMWVCLCFYVVGYIEFQILAHRQQQSHMQTLQQQQHYFGCLEIDLDNFRLLLTMNWDHNFSH